VIVKPLRKIQQVNLKSEEVSLKTFNILDLWIEWIWEISPP
jgi:hypothetical protein